MALKRHCTSQTTLDPKTPESNKSVFLYSAACAHHVLQHLASILQHVDTKHIECEAWHRAIDSFANVIAAQRPAAVSMLLASHSSHLMAGNERPCVAGSFSSRRFLSRAPVLDRQVKFRGVPP